ncbi:hypothetical protein MXD59_21875 [Frankia sp. Ag45/Mut15]|uniref:Uncharacterized protein n=1 Tax=Frankia umida TaxID=573489 RepID=A0ABT0K3L0_9ACTN|nr:hypothetical protein [Frankia umida]MCK9878386.1 hypothetical protein [Frankia umida]
MSAYTVELPVPARPPGHRFRLVVGVVVLTVTVLVVTDRLLVRLVEHRLATRLACLGVLGNGMSSFDGVPFGAHLDTVTPSGQGVRVQMSISGAAFDLLMAAHPSCGGI